MDAAGTALRDARDQRLEARAAPALRGAAVGRGAGAGGALGPLPVERPPRDVVASGLMALLHGKDPSTHRHSQRVGELSARTAAQLDLGPDQIAKIRRAALLHDIGKVAVPRALLRERGALDADQTRIMRRHAVLGQAILVEAGLPEEAAWVRHHHERPDGLGYPDGLRGAAIPLASRIIRVADALEAMTSDRPYRRAGSVAQALAELERHAGTEFDRGCLAALFRVAVASELGRARPAERSTRRFHRGGAPGEGAPGRTASGAVVTA